MLDVTDRLIKQYHVFIYPNQSKTNIGSVYCIDECLVFVLFAPPCIRLFDLFDLVVECDATF